MIVLIFPTSSLKHTILDHLIEKYETNDCPLLLNRAPTPVKESDSKMKFLLSFYEI